MATAPATKRLPNIKGWVYDDEDSYCRVEDEEAREMVTDAYDASVTYKKGETRIQDNKLYRAKVDITTAEIWTPDHWEETSLEQIRAEMATEISKANSDISALNAKSIKVKAFKFLNTGSWQGKNTILSIDTGIDNYEDGKEFAVAFAANSEVDTKLIYIPCVKNNRWYVSSNCYTDGGAGPNGFFFVVLTI